MFEDDTQGETCNPYAVENVGVHSFERPIDLSGEPAKGLSPRVGFSQIATEDIPGMRAVKSGLKFYYHGLCLLSLCWFLSVFFARQGADRLATILQIGTVLGLLSVLAGEVKCLGVPRKTCGFACVLFSVLFYALSVTVYLVMQALRLKGEMQAEPWFPLHMLQLFFGFLANILFLTFIIRLTRYMDNRRLFEVAVKARQKIWGMTAYVCVVIFIFAVLVQQRLPAAKQLAFFVLGVGIVGFVLLVYSWLQKFSRLVRDTSWAIVIEDDMLPTQLDISP